MIRFAFHEEPTIRAFTSTLAKKEMRSRLHHAPQQEIEAPQNESLSTFNALVLQHQDAAYNFAYYLLGDPDTAADATQQSFIKAYLNFSRFHGADFRCWLFKILKNTCIDELRREKRRNTYSLTAVEEDDRSMLDCFHLSDQLLTPEQAVDQKETSRKIQSALSKLDDAFRTALILVDVQGMDYQEAAQVTGVPLGTLKSRLARARRQFQQVLEQ